MKNFLNCCQNRAVHYALKWLAWWKPHALKLTQFLKPYGDKLQQLWLPQKIKISLWAKPYQAQFHTRWSALAKREKQTILLGSGLSALLLFYVLIWSPLDATIDELRIQIKREKNTAAWMAAADKQIKNFSMRQTSGPKTPPLQLNALQEKISQAPVHEFLSQLTQVGPNEIRCSFNQIEFDTLITWLIDFAEQEKLVIKQANVHRLNNVGAVQAEFVFQAG